MKYRVGDKVKIINNKDNDFEIGEVATIDEIYEGTIDSVYCKNEHNDEWLTELEVTPLEYTWEDFLKAPIGTKVTFESGDILVKDNEIKHQFDSMEKFRSYDDLIDFKDSWGDKPLGKITKIEEPIYTTVYEQEEVTMPEIEEMKRLTDELYKTFDEFIKKMKEKK